MELLGWVGSSDRLRDEQAVLAEVGRRCLELADLDLGSVSRAEFAERVVGLAVDSELVTAVAGRFMELGEDTSASLVLGESSMIRLVNAQGHLSWRRSKEMSRAGTTVHTFPHFHSVLMAGKITLGHIDLMWRQWKRSDTRQLRAAEKSLAALAVLCTPEEFASALAMWQAAADANEHLDEYLKRHSRRGVGFQYDLFGTAYLDGTLTPTDGEHVEATVEARARQLRDKNPELTVRQARHDALVDLILNPDGHDRPRPVIEYIAPDTSNERCRCDSDHSADSTDQGSGLWNEHTQARLRYQHRSSARALAAIPAFRDLGFAGINYPRTGRGTPIPPAILNAIKPRARVTVNPINPDGTLINDKAAGRHFTIRQKRMIRLRDNHCRHPGCRRPARYCQYDHITPYTNNGPTLVANGQLLCPFHHRWKHRHNPKPTQHHNNRLIDSPLYPQQPP
jgi:hypothetical protein